jgi:hypothetical protein
VTADAEGVFYFYVDTSDYSNIQLFKLVISYLGNTNTYDNISAFYYDNYYIDALGEYGSGTAYTQSTIEAALTAIGTTNKATMLLRPGTWVIANDLTIPANITVKLPPGTLLTTATTKSITFNGPVEIGKYQVFSGFAAGDITGLSESRMDWFAGTDDVALQAALNSITVGNPGPVYLREGLMTITGSIALPKGAILKGANEGGEVTAVNNASYIYHAPTVAGVELFTTDATAANPVHLSDFYILGSTGTATSKCAINLRRMLQATVKNVTIYGPFATAAMVIDSVQDLRIDNLTIGNQDTTTTTPAAILLKATDSISTTTDIYGLYIQGHLNSATGGITKGIVAEDDAMLGMNLYNPKIESLTQTAIDLDCGNTVDIISPYTENIPNTNAAYALFNVGLTTPAASYGTYLNIMGGIIAGGNNGYASNYGFSLGKYDKINVIGTQFQRIGTFQTDDATDHLGIFTLDKCSGAAQTFGTVTAGKNWDIGQTNRFVALPANSRSYGAIASLPGNYLTQGQIYRTSDYNATFVYNGIDVRSFTYDTGSHAPTIGQALYGETSGAVISVLAVTNTGGWAGAGTGKIYYALPVAAPVNGEHFHEAAAGAGNLVCNTTSASTNESDVLGWQIQNGTGSFVTLEDSATPDLSYSGGLIPQSCNYHTVGTTSITDFLHPQKGQIINLVSLHSIEITDGTTIILAGGVSFVMKSGDTLTLQYDAALGAWVERARSVN